MKRRSEELMKRGLAAALAVAMAASTPLPMAKEAKAEGTPVTANIYPVPQNVEYSSEEGMSFEGKVNVVMHGEQEHATETKLDEILKANGIDYEITDHRDESKANIIISSANDHCDECAVEDEVFENKEAYILTASNDTNSKGEVTIVGADEDGAYYGVLSLAQILGQQVDGKFAELVVKDYPEIEFRGFIEGFYGYPWSHEDRMSLMKDTGKYKMNTYIYAPKDDPYHRAQWRQLYPEKEAAQIAELAQAGKDSNFNFCWTIHPGDSLDLYSESDFQACIAKLEQLYSLGVRQFGVLFDDISRNQNGTLQANFINRIDDEFVKVKGDVKPLIMVGTRYCGGWGPSMTGYFKPLVQTLHSDIEIMWTGANTMSKVSKEIYDWPATQTGIDRELAVWWNYPVNDYCDAKLLMGAMPNLIPDLDNVNSFFSNPMNQAEASKVSLYSVADYTWNTDAYDYQASWERSVEELVPEAAEEFKRFASNISYLKDGITVEESEYLQEKVDALTAAVAAKGDVAGAAKALLAEFRLIKEDCVKLKALNNANLQKEINVHLGAYEELADACISAMNAIIAATEGKVEVSLAEAAKAKQFIANMDNYTIKQLEGNGIAQEYIVDVGTHVLKPLVGRSVINAQELISESLSPVLDAAIITNVKGLTGEVSLDMGSYHASDIETALKPGEYVGMVLPKVTPIGTAAAEGTGFEGCDFEYSINGVDWIKADTASVSKVYATYIRVINNTDRAADVNITKLIVTPIYKIFATADTSLGTYESYKISNVVDNNLGTKFWSNTAPSKGDHITVDLGSSMPVYDVTGYFGSGDKLDQGILLISEDGKNFTKADDVAYVLEDGNSVTRHDLNGQMARYIRFQEESTNNGYWLQCFEIKVNQTIDSGDMEGIVLAQTNTNGDAAKVYDGDLETAFAPSTVADDSYLTYQMSRINDVHELSIIQDADSICNAKVSVKNAAGEWVEVGTLDRQVGKFTVDSIVSEVRLDFNSGNPAPVIYEIFVSQREAAEEAVYNVTVNGEVAASGAYNEKVTIEAPVVEGKTFTGWKLNGVLVSTNPSYTFYIAGDMAFEACYEAVEVKAAAMLVGTQLTKQDGGKADAKFVGQLVVPEGSSIVNAGLVWSSNDDAALKLASGAKETYIKAISNTYQFSVTIKGVPEERFVRGKVFATIVNAEGKKEIVYSGQEVKLTNK